MIDTRPDIDLDRLFRKYPELEELLAFFNFEVRQFQRPANEVILDDEQLRGLLRVSKRTTATYRSSGLIPYTYLQGKVFYILEDILNVLKHNKVTALSENLRIK